MEYLAPPLNLAFEVSGSLENGIAYPRGYRAILREIRNLLWSLCSVG